MDFYNYSESEIVKHQKTDISSGLGEEEVKKRQAEFGPNEFEQVEHTSLIVKFLNQFKSFMIIVLIVAGVISGVIGVLEGEGFTDAIIILAIVLINAIIGVAQEAKAEKSLDALKRMSAPHCKVIRNGMKQIVESRELVPGDLVELETGDSVPADLRLVEAVNLKIQEAALTGESVPTEKISEALIGTCGLGDRVNMAFQSCSVTYGRGRGIVVATGTSTEVGKIASMIQSVPETKTPLQIRLDKLGKLLAWAALGICAVIFLAGLLYGRGVLEMFMTAVSLAAAAIPEGLPAVSTIVLALGVQRLAQRNAIVRNMPSVETLGSTTVICSDKTGTLTQNKMTVVKAHSADEAMLARIGVLCNDATINDEGQAIGDPTETALVSYGAQKSALKLDLAKTMPRVAELPFDSDRKLMSTAHRVEGGVFVAVKGGFDELLGRCVSILDASGVRPLEQADREKLAATNEGMAKEALRVLCMACKQVDSLPASGIEEAGLTFVGMVGMIDPPREEVKLAVAKCGEAGIRPVMITGDHKITAMAIARQLGILKDGDTAYTGADVEAMSDEQLRVAVLNASVFARVSPEHKVRIVSAFQKNGNVVAMTGDGVNDAPALKLADIGVAMGITGTDVSKEAADVVLTDDNFATIVSSVEEGRRIYDNVLKTIKFMLSTNFGELMLLFVAVMCNLPAPLLPIHILWINLVTDSLPALALGFDQAEDGIMRRLPLDPKAGIMTRSFTAGALFRGLMIAGLSLVAYFVGAQSSPDIAMTMTFAVVALSQLSILLCVRAGKNHVFHKLFTNAYLWMAIAFVLVLMLAVLLVPALQSIFHVVPLSDQNWWCVAGLSLVPMLVIEAGKLLKLDRIVK